MATRLYHDGHIPQVPNRLVVNSYQPGDGFWDHIDQSVFGHTILSLSLGSTCIMRFARDEPAAVEELLLEPGSLFVLTGPSRWDWTHGIPARTSDAWRGREYERARRISFTFRAVPAASGLPGAVGERRHFQNEA